MWEKLEQIARRCAEIGELLTVPEIYGDAKELRRLTQEQKELEPVAQCYEDYRRAERTIAEATELLSDAELRDMAQEELRQAKADKERLYEELRVLHLPRDPNDGKNVIMELRGGVGGEESALFAADLYRMYSMYAEKHGWKIELLNYNDTELGGVKEADFILNGAGAWSRLKFESGVHRVQRVPETERGASTPPPPRSRCCRRWRRSTSTSGRRTSRCRSIAPRARADSTSTRRAPPCG